jgi:adenylate kinase
MYSSGKVIIFLGPPGSGKGTQAARISSTLDVPAISTGEMLRRECHSGSQLGTLVQTVLASGQLVSDSLVNQVVASRLSQHDCSHGCILDGYPRTVSQARFLDTLLAGLKMPRPIVFDFDVQSEELVARLSRRRQCPECGRIFSLDGCEISAELFCDRDGARLVQRNDDNPASVRERLRLYTQNARELARYYGSKDYYRISATRNPAEISGELLSILEFPWTIDPAELHRRNRGISHLPSPAIS